MRRVVVVGAGIGGLATALILGREGRDVIVCERDPAPVPASPEAMWSDWPRPGTPHSRLGHTFLPGFRRLLEQRAPDVLELLWAAGAPPVDFSAEMPGGDRLPEDAEMTGIMCRRGVLEGILRQVVVTEPRVEIRAGCRVEGLLAAPPPPGGVPEVVGVSTDCGAISAEVVVVAGGRLLPVARWLEAIGARAPEEVSEGCGSVTFTRYFRVRLRAGEDEGVLARLFVIGELGYMRYEVVGADRATFCVELEPPTEDRELRCLRHEPVFMAAARALREGPEWLDPDRSTPIGPVVALGQERNMLRHLVPDGRPLALGLHVIGDARCQTNSVYAWGSGSVLAQAAALSDVLIEYRSDPMAQALAFEAAVGEEIADRHALSLARDRASGRRYRGEQEWDASAGDLRFIEQVVVPAADHDAEIFRAVNRRELQLAAVKTITLETSVLDRARMISAGDPPRMPATPGPTREALLQLAAMA